LFGVLVVVVVVLVGKTGWAKGTKRLFYGLESNTALHADSAF
jgi:hypothetical protein